MNVFGEYADYYDAFYKEKSYLSEAAFVDKLIRTHIGNNSPEILDFGCGTGKHACEMSALGYHVCGVDRSERMIRQACERSEGRAGLKFLVGDIRCVDAGRRFDAVTSLFHVISYLPADEDQRAVFQNARRHLREGGVFLFDFWHGPAVKKDPPVQREKTVESGDYHITRRATPKLHRDAPLVEITYNFSVKHRNSGAVKNFEETHVMRYLFSAELEKMAESCGLRLIRTGTWLEEGPPRDDNWNAWAMAVL